MARVSTRGAESEVLPRYVFLEPLLSGARILEVDAVALTGGRSARFLLERGALQVTAIDADEAAVGRATGEPDLALDNLTFRAADYRTLRPADYDLVIVHSPVNVLSEPKALVALKHQLASSGRLVLVLRRPAGMALRDPSKKDEKPPREEDLLAALRKSFQSVEVAVQTAFVGYSIVPTGVEEPATALDESLVDNPPAAYHLYICGTRGSGLDTASLTPLPSQVMKDLLSGDQGGPAEASLSLFDDFDQDLANQRIRDLELRTEAALEESRRSELHLAQALAERDHLRARMKEAPAAPPPAEAQPELAALKEEAEQLRAALAGRDSEVAARDAAVQSNLGVVRSQLENARAELASQRAALEAELNRATSRVEQLTSELLARGQAQAAQDAGLRAEADGARERVAQLEAELSVRGSALEQRQGELASLQARLGELESAPAELQAARDQATARAEQLASELIPLQARNAELEVARAELQTARDRASARADQLASELAVLEAKQAELEASRAGLQSARDQATARAVQLASDLAALQPKLAALEETRAELQAGRDESGTRADQLAAEVEALRE